MARATVRALTPFTGAPVKPEPVPLGPADALAVRAMGRVLAAEREAEAQIAECERRCQEEIEEARAARRALLARAQQRIVALHERAARAAAERSAALLAQSRAQAQGTPAPPPARMQAALESLVTQLIAGDGR